MVVGGGYATFPVRVSKGEADFSITESTSLLWAYQGVEAFKEKYLNLRAINGAMEGQYGIFVVLADVPINSLEEVKEKRYPIKLGVGQVGRSDEYVARKMLEAVGLSYDAIKAQGGTVTNAAWEQIGGLLRDRMIDGYLGGVTRDNPTLEEVAIARPLRFLPFSEAVIKKIVAIGRRADVLPAKSYTGQDKDVPSIVDDLVLFTRAEVPSEVVYTVTKAIIEGKDKVAVAWRAWEKEWDPVKGASKVPILLHPGAELYYKEKGWI